MAPAGPTAHETYSRGKTQRCRKVNELSTVPLPALHVWYILAESRILPPRPQSCPQLWIYLEDGLGALRDGVFGDVTGKEDAYSALDLARGQGDLFVVAHVLAAWPPRR